MSTQDTLWQKLESAVQYFEQSRQYDDAVLQGPDFAEDWEQS